MSKKRYIYRSLIDFAGRQYHQKVQDDKEYNEVSSKEIHASIIGLLTKLFFLIVGGCSSCAMPVYVYIFKGINTSTICVRVPFTEEDSSDEYMVNMILQTSVLIVGFFHYLGMETSMNILQNFIRVSPEVVKIDLRRLEEKRSKGEFNEFQMRLQFQNIIKKAIDTDEYLFN